MHIAGARLKNLCRKRGLSLKELLTRGKVSKTAYYHLLYKETILPRSIHALSDVLDVKPSAFLEEVSPAEKKIFFVAQMTDEIVEAYPTLDRENVRHTLLLLQEAPIERMRRALVRGRNIDLLS